MKINIIALLLFILSVSSVSAQKKGNVMVGGEIGGMFVKTRSTKVNNVPNGDAIIGVTDYVGDNDYTNTVFQFTPGVGKFLTDNLCAGLGLEYLSDLEKHDDETIDKIKVSSYMVYPFVRYYLYKGLYCQVRYNFGRSKQEIDGNKTEVPSYSGISEIDYTFYIKTRVTGFGITPGYSFLLKEHVMLDLSLSYLYLRNRADTNSAASGNGSFKQEQHKVFLSAGFKYLF
jgi:outer membrane protein W